MAKTTIAQVEATKHKIAIALQEALAAHAAEKAEHAKTKERLAKARADHVATLRKNVDSVAQARETERKQNAAAYEKLSVYAGKLRSALALILDNATVNESDKERAGTYIEAVALILNAKPPEEIRDAFAIVRARMEEASVRGARTYHIAGAALDVEAPRADTVTLHGFRQVSHAAGYIRDIGFGAIMAYGGDGMYDAGWGTE